jgi:hypothetical protein
MNSRKRILLHVVPYMLLAGVIPALTQEGGGRSGHGAEHRAPPPATAARAAESSRTSSLTTASPQSPTPTRTNTAGGARRSARIVALLRSDRDDRRSWRD